MTLTQAAVLTKRLMLFGGIFILVSLAVWLGYRYYYYNIYLPNLPKFEEKPDNRFGTLETPAFPKTIVSPSNFSYAVDTETGELPQDLPKIMRVYFATQLSITLLGPDRANNLASSFGFGNGPVVLSPTQYQYTNDLGDNFFIDLNSGNFNFKRNVATDSAELKDKSFSSKETIEQSFRTSLSKRGLLMDGLSGNKINTTTDRNVAKVTIWPDDIENYPIVTDKLNQGLIFTQISTSDDDIEKFLNFTYIFWPIDQTIFGTYAIKNASQAFDDLKNGQGVILKEPGVAKVSLRKIYLAYFQSDIYTPYIQPIYIFEGENFIAYVEAITSDFLATKN